ncbi:MAG: hypothetical protein IJW07_03975, partial [Lentisphaeria bacterium]|nr:hypothetical protein [Lentisphaeria bacterium]
QKNCRQKETGAGRGIPPQSTYFSPEDAVLLCQKTKYKQEGINNQFPVCSRNKLCNPGSQKPGTDKNEHTKQIIPGKAPAQRLTLLF